jgi:hypothetical protein
MKPAKAEKLAHTIVSGKDSFEKRAHAVRTASPMMIGNGIILDAVEVSTTVVVLFVLELVLLELETQKPL